MLVIEQTNGRELERWSDINWTTVEGNVRHLQGRIFRATIDGDLARVKNLQKLLVRSMSAKLKAIRQVTQENGGKHTPGIDGMVCDTPKARLVLLKSGLSLKDYQPKPVRRVYIPKANGKKRPLGVPTVKDRVMQAIVKMALEPEWERRFEANSYGFRPGRSCHDAIEAIHTTLNRKGCAQWVLDADISGCFDNIDHDALLKRLPVFTTTIRRWLKAGVVELGNQKDTTAGTPQGGIISPLLANIALDGLERQFGCERPNGKLVSPALRRGKNHGLNLIRYADDFVVTAPSREVLEDYVIPTVQAFLAQRGLTLSEAKTRIVHVDEGFTFLGFEIRRFGGVLLTKPQKEKVRDHLRAIKTYLAGHKQTPVATVIKELTPVIRGWACYYRHCAAKETFSKATHWVWAMTWTWAKRRHPNKSSKWIKARYFLDDGYWTLSDGTAKLYRHSATRITRFTKVIGRSSPMNPTQKVDWEERKKRQMVQETFRRDRLQLLQAQNNACGLCGMTFWPGDPLDDHHLVPRHTGGGDERDNRMLVHRWCHHAHHQRHGYKAVEA
jgi:RNA-directed DNA polymerase